MCVIQKSTEREIPYKTRWNIVKSLTENVYCAKIQNFRIITSVRVFNMKMNKTIHKINCFYPDIVNDQVAVHKKTNDFVLLFYTFSVTKETRGNDVTLYFEH